MLWADNYIVRRGDAYTNYTSTFYPDTGDMRLGDNLVAYSSPHKQWVFDEHIESATVASGIMGKARRYNQAADHYVGHCLERVGVDLDLSDYKKYLKQFDYQLERNTK